MADNNHIYSLKLNEDITAKLRKIGNSTKVFGRKTSRSFAVAGVGLKKFSTGVDRLTPRFTGLVTAIGGGLVFKKLADYQERLKKFGVAANLTGESLDKFNNNLDFIAKNRKITTSSTELLGASEAFLSRTGDALTKEQLTSIGLVQTAVGGLTSQYGELFAVLANSGLAESEQIETFQKLYAVGKKAAIPLNELVAIYPRLSAAASLFAGSKTDNLDFANVLLQAAQSGKGTAEATTTGIEQYTRLIKDLQTKGDITADATLQKASDALLSSLSGLTETEKLAEFKRLGFAGEVKGIVETLLGKTQQIKELSKIQADTAKLIKDADDATKSFNQQIQDISDYAFIRLKTKALPVLEKISKWLHSLDTTQIDKIIDRTLLLAKVLAGIYASAKLIQIGSFVGRTAGALSNIGGRKSGSSSGALGGLGGLRGSTPATPLYVIDIGGGLGGGLGKKGRGKARARGKIGVLRNLDKIGNVKGLAKLGQAARFAGPALGILGAGVGIASQALSGEENAKTKAGIQTAGAVAGGVAGAVFGPIGFAIGTAAGAFIADRLDDKLIGYFQGMREDIQAGNQDRLITAAETQATVKYYSQGGIIGG